MPEASIPIKDIKYIEFYLNNGEVKRVFVSDLKLINVQLKEGLEPEDVLSQK